MWDFNGLGMKDPAEVPFLLVEARAGSGLKSTQKLLSQSVFCEVKWAGDAAPASVPGGFLYKNLRPPRAASLMVTSLYVQLSKRASEGGVYGRHLFGRESFIQTRGGALTCFLGCGFVDVLDRDCHVGDD